MIMERWFTLARDLPSTISARWRVPWTSALPSALKDVGHEASKTLLLPSAGVLWILSALRAPSPGPLGAHSPGLSPVPGRESASRQSVCLLQPGWPREGRLGREWHQRTCSLNGELAACTGYHKPVQPRHKHPPQGLHQPRGGGYVSAEQSCSSLRSRASAPEGQVGNRRSMLVAV